MNPHLVFAEYIASRAITIWLPIWLIRKGRKVDARHSRAGMLIRWAIVLGCLLLVVSLPPPGFVAARIVFGIVGLIVLCWPNFVWNALQNTRFGAKEASLDQVS